MAFDSLAQRRRLARRLTLLLALPLCAFLASTTYLTLNTPPSSLAEAPPVFLAQTLQQPPSYFSQANLHGTTTILAFAATDPDPLVLEAIASWTTQVLSDHPPQNPATSINLILITATVPTALPTPWQNFIMPPSELMRLAPNGEVLMVDTQGLVRLRHRLDTLEMDKLSRSFVRAHFNSALDAYLSQRTFFGPRQAR